MPRVAFVLNNNTSTSFVEGWLIKTLIMWTLMEVMNFLIVEIKTSAKVSVFGWFNSYPANTWLINYTWSYLLSSFLNSITHTAMLKPRGTHLVFCYQLGL